MKKKDYEDGDKNEKRGLPNSFPPSICLLRISRTIYNAIVGALVKFGWVIFFKSFLKSSEYIEIHIGRINTFLCQRELLNVS